MWQQQQLLFCVVLLFCAGFFSVVLILSRNVTPREQNDPENGKGLGRDKNSDLQRLGEFIIHHKPRVIAIAATDMNAKKFHDDIQVCL